MLTCPMCKKGVAEETRHCPRCGTDLSLLVDYVGHVEESVARADRLTRAGNLDGAVWAYLEVLEVDPENAAARRQVGRVATAVRQFDRAAPGRRWLRRLRHQARFRRWLSSRQADAGWRRGASLLLLLVLLAGCFLLGYHFGSRSAREGRTPEAPAVSPAGGDGAEVAP